MLSGTLGTTFKAPHPPLSTESQNLLDPKSIKNNMSYGWVPDSVQPNPPSTHLILSLMV